MYMYVRDLHLHSDLRLGCNKVFFFLSHSFRLANVFLISIPPFNGFRYRSPLLLEGCSFADPCGTTAHSYRKDRWMSYPFCLACSEKVAVGSFFVAPVNL